RQDPDVIQVGEMRDLDTIQTALTAAETGHIVISTLHTPDAPQAVDRIVDVFPPYQQAQIRLQLSLTLKGVIAQRLLPRKDKPGVVVAIEILVVNPAVRNLIRKGQTQEIYSIMEISSKLGMQSMNVSLKEHYERGFIDYDTALGCSPDPENFEKVLKVKEGKATNGGGVKFM
ncbi:MAG: type IV pilus twitching motility protein PilT, partial [Gammaproteobacteria bacterium]|nr:type IV pilus twitching motility protein PilT [Gammaproteobacteria bacterium]